MQLISKASISVSYLVTAARAMIDAAESLRRESNLGFDPAARPAPSPDTDWAVAGLLIGRAMHHLDESLPNGQKERTMHALGALQIGVELLVAELASRGVNCSILSFGEQPAAPPAPAPNPASHVFAHVSAFAAQQAEVAALPKAVESQERQERQDVD